MNYNTYKRNKKVCNVKELLCMCASPSPWYTLELVFCYTSSLMIIHGRISTIWIYKKWSLGYFTPVLYLWWLWRIIILTGTSASIYHDQYSHKKHKISQSQHSADYLKEINEDAHQHLAPNLDIALNRSVNEVWMHNFKSITRTVHNRYYSRVWLKIFWILQSEAEIKVIQI